MKLDNRKNVFKIWFWKFVLTSVLLILLVIFIFSDQFKNPVLGQNKSFYLIILGVIYLFIIIINYLLKQNFVFYGDVGDKIIIRYYPVRILNQKKHSIEIPKNRFVRYETEKFFFGLKERIFLFQKTQNGIARYPGVSLSAVDKKDILQIRQALDQYTRMNRGK